MYIYRWMDVLMYLKKKRFSWNCYRLYSISTLSVGMAAALIDIKSVILFKDRLVQLQMMNNAVVPLVTSGRPCSNAAAA